MERPALQKPPDDVRARKIDVIVVWGWISARIRRRDRLQLSRNDPFVMARAMPALSRARRSRGKSRVESFETRIGCCGARAANHQGTTRPARARQDEGRVELAADGQQRRGNNSRAARRVHPAGGLKEVPVRQSAYQAGYRAYNLGLGRCPHSRGSFLSQSWWGGWWDAQRAERAAERNQLRPPFARTSNDALFGM